MSTSKPIRMGRYLGPSRTAQPISKVNWRLLIAKNGDLYLHHLALLSTDQADDILRKLVEKFEGNQSWFIKAVPFLVPVVYTTTISPVHENVTQALPRMVDIEDKHRCHVLTNALRKFKTLPSGADFITSYSRFAVVDETPEDIHARCALLVQLELSKVIILLFLVCSLILSAVLGVVVGVWRQSLDSGLGVGGGILGLIGVVEGMLTWWLK